MSQIVGIVGVFTNDREMMITHPNHPRGLFLLGQAVANTGNPHYEFPNVEDIRNAVGEVLLIPVFDVRNDLHLHQERRHGYQFAVRGRSLHEQFPWWIPVTINHGVKLHGLPPYNCLLEIQNSFKVWLQGQAMHPMTVCPQDNTNELAHNEPGSEAYMP